MKYFFSFLCFLLIFACQNSAPEQAPKQEIAKPTVAEKIESIESNKKRIVFFGNSLSAAYGLENKKDGFVGLIRSRIDSLGLEYEVVNAGLSGETTGGGVNRVDWVISEPVDIFVLELGGNDALRGLEPEVAEQNLQKIIDKVKTKYPEVQIVLAGMQAPQNLGNEYTDRFAKIYPDLAKKNAAALIPFLLEQVGGVASMNLPDGIHPNLQGHRIVAENVWETLEEVIQVAR
ncbi:MAG: arylesterase [Bacteroidota bacterium]